jgi:hypothetical protein
MTRFGVTVAFSEGMRRILQISIGTSALLVALCSAASAQVSFDVHIGQAPPPPRAYVVPAQPGPDYVWVEGYWYPQGSQYKWHNGYWTRPPYPGAYWVAPYHSGSQYYAGRWEGPRGDVFHDHRWDQTARRDEHREPHRGEEHARRH